MIVLCRFEGGRNRSFRNAPHPLSDVLCGLAYAVGRKAFLLSLPGRFVDDFTMTVTGKVQKFVMRETMIRELGLEVEKTA